MFQNKASFPSRAGSIFRKPASQPEGVKQCGGIANKHYHVVGSNVDEITLPTSDWICKVDQQIPTLAIKNQKPKNTPLIAIPEGLCINNDNPLLPPSLLLRITKSAFRTITGSCQVKVKFAGIEQTSCPSNKISNSIFDYFLINLNSEKLNTENNIWEEEIIITVIKNTVPSGLRGRVKSIRTKAKDIFKGNKEEVETEATFLSIPVSSLFLDQEKVDVQSDSILDAPQLEGNFYVRNQGQIVGEMTIHLIASPGAFLSLAPEIPKDTILYKSFLTKRKDSQRWERSHAIIKSKCLQLENEEIDLSNVVNVTFHDLHEIGIENAIQVDFANQERMICYADCGEEGIKWLDSLYRAVWNQPYQSESAAVL